MRKAVPLVAAVNDLSGFGRCSLTAAIPILSAMGMQVCPLPTAVLSNHTGYESCYFTDFTGHMDAYIREWEKLDLDFDAIFTGFLGNCSQVEKITRFIDRFKQPGTLVMVDPVMADDGVLYPTYTDALCQNMKQLVSKASVVTPNLTEACILADADYTSLAGDEKGMADLEGIFQIAEQIADTGPAQVVVTGVHTEPGKIANICLDRAAGERFVVATPLVGHSFAGTGDVFSSLLCGYQMRGEKLQSAVKKTAEMVGRVTAYSCQQDTPWLDGIAFEPFLKEL